MEEDEKTQTVVRKVVLAPTSKRFTDIEAQIQQLHSTINGLTQWLEQQLHTGQQERDSIQKADQPLLQTAETAILDWNHTRMASTTSNNTMD
jgi:hypothetical protein